MSSAVPPAVGRTACSDSDFDAAITSGLNRRLNVAQRGAVFAAVAQSQFIVAGPGSGKTTVLALRVLRYVFVDGVAPESIIATTFTRKAASELRSRILASGDTLKRTLVAAGVIPAGGPLDRTDLNAVWTGTLDSLSEQILGEFRPPGSQSPAVIEEFVARAQMLRQGLFPNRRFQDADLAGYLEALRGTSFGLNAPSIAGLAGNIRQRLIHDGVDRAAYNSRSAPCVVCTTHPHPGISVALAAIDDYEQFLAGAGVVDFAGLEERFLRALQQGDLPDFIAPLRHVLIDEYQDTNWLQEQIYLFLASACVYAGGSVTVVGDDDQSLYRFRGATVDLFRDFPARAQGAIGQTIQATWLVENYRSTQDIVDFCNAFIALDPAYQSARIAGKPAIRHARSGAGRLPILGLFRDDPAQVAHEVSSLLDAVFNGSGYVLPGGQTVERDPLAGGIGDCALLAHSVREHKTTGAPRFPLLLRQELDALPSPLRVFNPRGQPLTEIESVQVLCGLVLDCIDPTGACQAAMRLPRGPAASFVAWRNAARAFSTSHPHPAARRALTGYLRSWAAAIGRTNTSVPLAELVYDLVYWLEPMQGDVEGLVHLEVIQRTITESARFGTYGGSILLRDATWHERSVKSAYWDVFVPIAEGAVDVDEDLLETLPTDRLNLMTVHQAKGLEFPFVIADIGVDSADRRAPARSRFPTRGEDSHALEDELRQFSVGLGPPPRLQIDRAFDDLTRLAFVAFSRPKDVLLVLGHSEILNRVQTVAAGWTRDGQHRWAGGIPNMVLL